jgi:hypothetical protein
MLTDAKKAQAQSMLAVNTEAKKAKAQKKLKLKRPRPSKYWARNRPRPI